MEKKRIKELKEERDHWLRESLKHGERIKELEAILSRVLYWDNGELPENAIRDIKQALSGSEKKAPVIISTNTPMPGR